MDWSLADDALDEYSAIEEWQAADIAILPADDEYSAIEEWQAADIAMLPADDAPAADFVAGFDQELVLLGPPVPDFLVLVQPPAEFSAIRRKRCKTHDAIQHHEALALVVAQARNSLRKNEIKNLPTDDLTTRLSTIISLVSSASKHASAQISEKLYHVCSRFWKPFRRVLHRSHEAAEADVHRDTVAKCQTYTSATAFLLDRSARLQMFQVLSTAPQIELIMILEFSTYDETSLPLRVSQTDFSAHAARDLVLSDHLLPQHHALDRLLEKLSPPVSDVAPAKVLQGHTSVVILMRIAGRLVVLRCPSLQCLQQLESQKASILKLAVNRMSIADTSFAAKCPIRVRAACTDDHGSNIVVEKSWPSDHDGWWQFRCSCKLHKVATVHKRGLDLVDSSVSKMINLCLGLQVGITVFRRVLHAEIMTRMVFVRGHPSDSHVELRRSLISMWVGAINQKSRLQARSLDLVCNGNWRNHKEVEIYVPDAASDELLCGLKAKIANLLVSCLCPRIPPVFPRSRWTGAIESVSSLGLMQSCHGLLEVVYPKFVRQVSMVGVCGVVGEGDGGRPSGDDVLCLAHDGGPQMPEDTCVPESDLTWSGRVAKARVAGLELLCGKPENMFIIVRVVLEPLQILRQQQFSMSGKQWDRRQRARLAKAVSNGGDVDLKARDYRLVAEQV
jgi:hypothetical protein